MQQAATRKDVVVPQSVVTPRIAVVRLLIGLLQGAVLYFLYRAAKANAWPATEEYLFAPLLLVCVLVPVILISSLGHLEKRQIGIWILAAAIIIGAMGFYDIWRGGADYRFGSGENDGMHARFPSVLVFIFTAAGFFIAHSLVLAGALDKQRIARYPAYFEMGWKLLIQLKFSALFVGALWLVLWLGAALFMLVKLHFLKDLLRESWFVIPVTAFAFSCAMHITDVRPAIVRGIRTLLLVLLSWILPITALMIAGFLLSLPWTGLAPLWATRHATAVLLGAAAVLVILINAAFQNGEIASDVARIVRISARLAALSLLPITAIAIYSLGLRVNDYGWTTDRIIVAACLLVASCYALGYAWAACRKTGWLAPVAKVNVATAFVMLAVLLSLFSPVADPARLSVNHQMARFESGKIGADRFDFAYLKFEGARYGLAALEQLKIRSHGIDAALVREKAELALKKKNRWSSDEAMPPVDIAVNLSVWPKTARLPASFLHENWREFKQKWMLPSCLTQQEKECDAYPIDFNGDGKPEVLMVGSKPDIGAVLMMEKADGHWAAAGRLPQGLAGCEPLREKLRAGTFQVIAPRMKDLDIAGQHIEMPSGVEPDRLRCPSP